MNTIAQSILSPGGAPRRTNAGLGAPMYPPAPNTAPRVHLISTPADDKKPSSRPSPTENKPMGKRMNATEVLDAMKAIVAALAKHQHEGMTAEQIGAKIERPERVRVLLAKCKKKKWASLVGRGTAARWYPTAGGIAAATSPSAAAAKPAPTSKAEKINKVAKRKPKADPAPAASNDQDDVSVNDRGELVVFTDGQVIKIKRELTVRVFAFGRRIDEAFAA